MIIDPDLVSGPTALLWFLLARQLTGRPATPEDVALAFACIEDAAKHRLHVLADRDLVELVPYDRARRRWIVTPMGRGVLRADLATELGAARLVLGSSPSVTCA